MDARASSRTRGFTLIELTVVMGVILVLISLLVPAVNSAREAARRIQCVNNLSQLALAMHHYQGIHQVFPPGVVNEAGPIKNAASGYHMGWIAQILPALEQAPLFHRLNFDAGAYAPENATAASTHLDVLICPSDPGAGRASSVSPLAQSNYAGCYHDREAAIGAWNQGMLFLNSAIVPEDVPDGLSQTLMLGEKLTNTLGLGWLSGTRATLRHSGFPPNDELTRAAGLSGTLIHRRDSETLTPPQPPGPSGPPVLSDPVGGFDSQHPGGANFAFGDGAVRFLKSTISRPVFRALGNRDDGELISSDTY